MHPERIHSYRSFWVCSCRADVDDWHSVERQHQLQSQHAGEFAKVKAANEFKVVAVASRKILCVNPKVKALGASWRINDECLQLQSKETSKKQVMSGMQHYHLNALAFVTCVLDKHA